MSSIKISLLAILVVAFCTVQLVESGISDMLVKFFDDNRVTRCPVPGDEFEFEEKITIKTLNFPKEPCKKLCSARGLVSMEGSEQISYGPKLFCCCKPDEAKASGAAAAASEEAKVEEPKVEEHKVEEPKIEVPKAESAGHQFVPYSQPSGGQPMKFYVPANSPSYGTFQIRFL